MISNESRVEHCNVNKVKSTRDKVKGDKVKNEYVKL